MQKVPGRDTWNWVDAELLLDGELVLSQGGLGFVAQDSGTGCRVIVPGDHIRNIPREPETHIVALAVYRLGMVGAVAAQARINTKGEANDWACEVDKPHSSICLLGLTITDGKLTEVDGRKLVDAGAILKAVAEARQQRTELGYGTIDACLSQIEALCNADTHNERKDAT